MNFFIADDSEVARETLINIIDQGQFGDIVGETSNGSGVTLSSLVELKVDILIMELLMPNKSGIEVLEELNKQFPGKIILFSRIEHKKFVEKAYQLGAEYYVLKPVSLIETSHIIRKVMKNYQLEKTIHNFRKSLQLLDDTQFDHSYEMSTFSFNDVAKDLLMDLGIVEENACRDFIDLLNVLLQLEKEVRTEDVTFKQIYQMAIERRHCLDHVDVEKERKAYEQRVRRAIHNALENTASLGLSDFTSSTFERYSTKFFDFSQVRAKMIELEGKNMNKKYQAKINIKKFISALLAMVKQELTLRSQSRNKE